MASGCNQVHVVHKPHLLSDNGSSYVFGDLAEWLKEKGMKRSRGAPYHPQTHGKIAPSRQIALQSPAWQRVAPNLEAQIEAFVEHDNHQRYQESIKITPADVYFGRDRTTLKQRERIKQNPLKARRLYHRQHAPVRKGRVPKRCCRQRAPHYGPESKGQGGRNKSGWRWHCCGKRSASAFTGQPDRKQISIVALAVGKGPAKLSDRELLACASKALPKNRILLADANVQLEEQPANYQEEAKRYETVLKQSQVSLSALQDLGKRLTRRLSKQQVSQAWPDLLVPVTALIAPDKKTAMMRDSRYSLQSGLATGRRSNRQSTRQRR